MCGVIGYYTPSWEKSDEDLLKKLLSRTSIRGLHATGLSYNQDYNIVTTRGKGNPNGVDFDLPKRGGGSAVIVAHSRYATSSFDHDQPCASPAFSVAHNGVVTQEPVSEWGKLFGIDTETDLDTELILRNHEQQKVHPLVKFPSASMACVVIGKSKNLEGFRNGLRPLYFSQFDKRTVFTSTADIARRCGIHADRCEAGVAYELDEMGDLRKTRILGKDNSLTDLQPLKPEFSVVKWT